jgi:hypothetical protein
VTEQAGARPAPSPVEAQPEALAPAAPQPASGSADDAFERRLTLAGVALAAAVVLALAVGLLGWALLLLAACLFAGAGLTYLSGLPLLLEERLAFGAVLGAMAACAAGFLLALLFGFGLSTVLGGLAVALAASLPGWSRGLRTLRADAADALDRVPAQLPLWILLGVSWTYTLGFLAHAYAYTAQGLQVGQAGIYADWALHLSYAASFAYGDNLPPVFPIAPDHRLAYPFMVDFFAASLVPLGTSLTSSLVETSGFLALAFPAVMYLVGHRLTGSRLAAAAAVLVFTMGGGLGWAYWIADVDRGGPGALLHPPRLYTQDVALNYQWLNPVLAWIVPQRSVLFGFAIALVAAALLWLAAREGGRPRLVAFAFAGAMVGLAPLFHVHAYGTALALAAFWALLDRGRHWLAFFVPAVALSLPAVLWLAQPGATALRWLPGWYADFQGYHDGAIWFWIKNLGLFVPLLLAAHLWRGLLPGRLALWLAPIWLWFLVPNFVAIHRWEWDNTKFFAFWYLFGALLVGALLARLARRSLEGIALAAVLLASLVLAGGLDLVRAADPAASGATFTDARGVEAAAWVRGHTEPHAVFLVAPEHNEAVAALGGRRLVAGYAGWLWTYGISDWVQRTDDAKRMLKGDAATPSLLRKYHVEYVVLGPQELSGSYGANVAYWQREATQVYSNGSYTVLRVG